MQPETRVKQIIHEFLGTELKDIELSSKLKDDLGADSLDAVEMVQALEEEFGIDIPDPDADLFVTVGDMIKFIESRVN